MKKTAKIVAIILSLMMVLSVASAYVIYADAAGAPTLTITETGKTGNQVTVAVNLTSGGFNAMDFQFNTSEGVTCNSIKITGDYDVKASNPTSGKAGMASTLIYDQPGSIITATFTVPEEGSYSISGSAPSCTVTENGGNREVGASVSGSVKGANTKPDDEAKKKAEEEAKKKAEEEAKKKAEAEAKKKAEEEAKKKAEAEAKKKAEEEAKKSGSTDSKKNNQSKNNTPAAKPKTTTSTTSSKIPTTKLPDELDTEESTTEETTLPEDEDVFDDDVIDDGWYSDDEYAEDADDAEAEEEDNGDKQVNKKAIAGIAGGAGALVAASVAAIVIANKKKKDDDEF